MGHRSFSDPHRIETMFIKEEVDRPHETRKVE